MIGLGINLLVYGAVALILLIVVWPWLKSKLGGAKIELPSFSLPDLSVLTDAHLEQLGFNAVQTLERVLAHHEVTPEDRAKMLDPITTRLVQHKTATGQAVAK